MLHLWQQHAPVRDCSVSWLADLACCQLHAQRCADQAPPARRFHNPDNYSRALAGVIRVQEQQAAEQGLSRLRRTVSDLLVSQAPPEPQEQLGGEAATSVMFSNPRDYALAGISKGHASASDHQAFGMLLGLGAAWHALTGAS